jgi:hypothetical protein
MKLKARQDKHVGSNLPTQDRAVSVKVEPVVNQNPELLTERVKPDESPVVRRRDLKARRPTQRERRLGHLYARFPSTPIGDGLRRIQDCLEPHITPCEAL